MNISDATVDAAARAIHCNAEARQGVRLVDRTDFDDLAASERRDLLEDAKVALTAAKSTAPDGEWVPHPMIPGAHTWVPAPGRERDYAGNLEESQ